MIVVDFETEEIVGNPIINPPKPCGVALDIPGQDPEYYAWGHPTENNCDWGDIHGYLGRLRDSGEELLFHNGPFDLSVWNKWHPNQAFGRMDLDWRRFHDTIYLLFLCDPYADTFALKPSAHRVLGMPPEEQDELRDWILAHVPGSTPKNFGKYISKAPGSLVGRYAVGDVVRTRRLYNHLRLKVEENGMVDAYDRERHLMPHLMSATRRGIPVDRHTLEWHTEVYSTCLEVATGELESKLALPSGGLGNRNLLASALESSGAVTEWVLTPTGKKSMAKENLRISDPTIKMYWEYISALETCLQTFMRPWLEYSANDGRLHPNWNQVRGEKRGAYETGAGARTGRLSSDSPNFQNVPTEFSDNKGTPLAAPPGLHALPLLRRYCFPEAGHIWVKRDYSSQEIRLLAHYEDGSLREAYRANPSLDPHQMAVDLIHAMIGIEFARKDVKITAFSIIYGSGAGGLSSQLHVTYDEAYSIKQAYLKAMPGVDGLMRGVQMRGKSGLPIKTLGGRIYYVEPSRVVNGAFRDFAYKLLNYLIQGSAADQTKMSMIKWFERSSWECQFLATVHDEIDISVPAIGWEKHMQCLQECMDDDILDVPVRSEGFIGDNWADLKEVA